MSVHLKKQFPLSDFMVFTKRKCPPARGGVLEHVVTSGLKVQGDKCEGLCGNECCASLALATGVHGINNPWQMLGVRRGCKGLGVLSNRSGPGARNQGKQQKLPERPGGQLQVPV